MDDSTTQKSDPFGGPYARELTDAQIAAGLHRGAVGGRWEEIGRWQFDLMLSLGLQSHHRLLDVGCGALRGGLHFIRYLEPANYFGLDINASLVKAGQEVELPRAGLVERRPHLLVSQDFEFSKFGATFPYALAVSVFTHLPINLIESCLIRLSEVLEPGGRFYATYFEASSRHTLGPVSYADGIATYNDRDPFHYHFSWFEFLVTDLPLRVRNLGDCGHVRSQHVLEFVRC